MQIFYAFELYSQTNLQPLLDIYNLFNQEKSLLQITC